MRFEPLVRPNFFDGRLLTAADLRQEQEHQRAQRRLQYRCAVGWGVVDGLRVSVEGESVVVSPGLAVDCTGQTLVLHEPLRLPLADAIGRVFVVLQHAEVPVGTVATPSPGADDDSRPEPASIRETVSVTLATADPLGGRGEAHAPRLGCGAPHGLGLAALNRSRNRWRVTHLRLPRRGR